MDTRFFYELLRVVNALGAAIVLWRMFKDYKALKNEWTPKLKNYYYALAGAIFVVGGRGLESMIQGNEGGVMTFGVTLVICWCLTAQWGGHPYELLKSDRGAHSGLKSGYTEDNLGRLAKWFSKKSEAFKMSAILLVPITFLGVGMALHHIL